MEFTQGMKVLDGWEIVRPIGQGGFGKVYEIRKAIEGTGQQARSALKVMTIPSSQSDVRSALSEGMDEKSVTSYFKEIVNQIVREVAVMTTLKGHPGIVSCEDHYIYEHPNEICWDILIRMELLTPLNDWQQRNGMTSADTARLGRELASALAYCQRKGFIHRDIKPENIFVTGTGRFKLGDFGVARSAERTTGAMSRKGTESYMAPEVYLGQPYGPTVDIYSLGLVLYRLLNGNRLPFFPPAPEPITFSDRENAIASRMSGRPIPPPKNADSALSAVVLRACAYRSSDRYATAAELEAALTAWERGDTGHVRDRTESVPYTAGAWGPTDRDRSTVGAWSSTVTDQRTVGAWGQSTATVSPGPGPRREPASFWSQRLPEISTRFMPPVQGELEPKKREKLRRVLSRLSPKHLSSQEAAALEAEFESGRVLGMLYGTATMSRPSFLLVTDSFLCLSVPGKEGLLAARLRDVRDAKTVGNLNMGYGVNTLKLLMRDNSVRLCIADVLDAEIVNMEPLARALREQAAALT